MKTADFADFFKSDLKSPSWLFSSLETHSGSYRTCQLCISFYFSSTCSLISVELLRSLFSCYKIYDIRTQVLTCAPCFLKFHLFLCISQSSERKNLKNNAVKKSVKESPRFSFWHRVKVKTADSADFFKADLKSPSWLFSSLETHSGSYGTCQVCISFYSSLFFLISVDQS